MAECILFNGGGVFDDSILTATPAKVRSGKIFFGNGSDSQQLGTLNEVPGATYNLPLNGRQDIPAGIHAGSVVVRQTGITTMGGQTVYVRDYDQTINTANKYMTGDVYAAPLTGLVPGNIKKGVTIRVGDKTVVGTYEGYN